MTFENMMQKVINLSIGQKIQIAIDRYEQLYPIMQKCDPSDNGMGLFSVILGTAAAADNGYLSVEKCAFVSAFYSLLFGVGLEEADIFAFVKTCHDMYADVFKIVIKFVNVLDTKQLTNLIWFLVVFFSIDGKVSREEYAYLAKLREN